MPATLVEIKAACPAIKGLSPNEAAEYFFTYGTRQDHVSVMCEVPADMLEQAGVYDEAAGCGCSQPCVLREVRQHEVEIG